MNQNLVISALLIFAFLASGFFLLYRTAAPGTAAAASLNSAAESVFNAEFNDLAGKKQALSQWRGKVIVLNFWATWCPPCRAEIPGFIALQKQYARQNVQFVGIAMDQKNKVKDYAAKMGMNYPVLLGEMEGEELARVTGNKQGGLPYTVIIDRNGNIASTKLGMLSHEKLEEVLKSLLKQ